jgi:hypothetical protein
MNMHKPLLLAGLVLAGTMTAGHLTPVSATATGGTSNNCRLGGTVQEHNFTAGVHHFIIHISDHNGVDFPGGRADLGNIPSGGDVFVRIPPNRFNDNNCDVHNDILPPLRGPNRPNGAGNASATLWLESQYYDAKSQAYKLESNFDFIHNDLGGWVNVKFPDLFADTNGDGVIGNGDYLYSYVNLEQFLANGIPSFFPGEVFSIVNGRVAALPGMEFSTAPFTFDPSTGWTTAGDYTGDGVVEADHELMPTPEPSSLLLTGSGILSAASLLRRRLRTRS